MSALPRRVQNDVTIDVWLERLEQIDDRVCNTWVLIGTVDAGGHRKGTLRLTSLMFRTQLAYVDSDRRIQLDDTGIVVAVTAITTLFVIGVIRMGAYTLDMASRHCSCKSYQYLQTEHGDRNCKHLNSLCCPSYAIVYTKQKQAFQLISETVPKKPATYRDWIYSRKHDGIRVRVEGTFAWTRGGMKIDLASIWTPPVGLSYDAELCIAGMGPSSHDLVLAAILAGKLQCVRLLLFDLFDPTGRSTCAQRLLRLWSLPIPTEYLVQYQMVHLWRGPSFLTRLAALNIGSPECEGVVVRNPGAVYDGSGSRSNRSIFKVKHAQWRSMLQTAEDTRVTGVKVGQWYDGIRWTLPMDRYSHLPSPPE
jgi:predicted nucleic acid-binding Zn finger protein